MDITTTIIDCAYRTFLISTLKPYQLLVIQRIIEQQEENCLVRNQVVILPTGTGKSLCFQIPAYLCNKKTIIIYPLLALMTDQKNRLERLGIKCAVLKGGQTKQQREEIRKELLNGTKIIITNPETLSLKSVQSMLSCFDFELFVVDEAHVISQWGKEFRPDYAKLEGIIKKIKPHQILAFTATASQQTLKDIEKVLFSESPSPLVVRGDSDRENIFYSSVFSPSKDIAVMKILKTCERPAIVFCGTRKDSELTALRTRKTYSTMDVRYYHAGLTKEERERIEQWFMKSADGVLCTTSAYGMGIDKPNIRTVIHRTLPSSAEEYLQESGRAGRDGESSIAWAVVANSEKDNENQVESIFSSFCCRRTALLKVLGETKEECSGCDFCAGTSLNLNSITKTLEAFIKRFPFRYTEQSAAALLCGIRIQWKTEKNGELNPYFSSLEEYSFEDVLNEIKKRKTDSKFLYPEQSKIYNFIVSIQKGLLSGYKKIIRFKSIFGNLFRKDESFDKNSH